MLTRAPADPSEPAEARPRGRSVSPLEALLARPPHERRIGPLVLKALLGKGGFAPVYLAAEIHGDVTLRSVAHKVFQTGVVAEGATYGAARARAAVIRPLPGRAPQHRALPCAPHR